MPLWRVHPDNWIGYDGCEALADGLMSNQALRSLYLSANRLGDDSCMALARSLNCNQTLKSLSMYGNFIGQKGCEMLACFLEKNWTLQTLFLCGAFLLEPLTSPSPSQLQTLPLHALTYL